MYKIPLVDLHPQYIKLKREIYSAINNIAKKGRFINGDDVDLFEKEFAQFCRSKYAVGTANGTVSIHVALKALGIGLGDEVITVPNTFIATSEAITQTGAKVVFCDIDNDTLTMDPDEVVKRITKKTKAIIPVHIHGNPCEMDTILRIAKTNNLFVIEDAAQAQGAEYKNKRIGNWGNITTFSFFPGKNIGAWGDAGGLVTNNKNLYLNIKALVNHGRREKYSHKIEGFNYRLDTIHAAILRIKLRYLENWNNLRRKNAVYYRELFSDTPEIEYIKEMKNGRSVYHLFVICHKQRDLIRKHLMTKGIETGVHYPLPLHLQPAYLYLNYKKGDFPIAEKKAKTILSLPMYPELTNNHIEKIVKYVKEALK